MRRTVCRFTVSLLLAVAAGTLSASAAESKAPTIVVAKTQATGIAYWQPAMGDGLAQMLITELSALPNFKVLESVALDDLRSERALGESGEVSEAESVKKGQWKGADYTFKSTVTRFGGKQNTYGGSGWSSHLPFGYGGFSVTKSENEVQIDWRIVDNATREVIVTGRADGVETGTGFNFSSWQGGGFSNNREFRDSALGKATMKAIAQIVDKVKTLDIGPGGAPLMRKAPRRRRWPRCATSKASSKWWTARRSGFRWVPTTDSPRATRSRSTSRLSKRTRRAKSWRRNMSRSLRSSS